MSEINRLLAFDPDAFKQEARDRVFMHVGRALNEWNRVEELTSVLFHRLLLCGAYAISSAGIIPALGARRPRTTPGEHRASGSGRESRRQ